MKVTEIAFVGYPVTDVKRARAFYEGVLGLEVSRDFSNIETGMEGDHCWVEYDLGGSTLALSNSWPPSGQSSPGAALEVDDFEAALEDLKKADVPLIMGPSEFPTCHMVIIEDPDKNPLIIHQRKPGNT